MTSLGNCLREAKQKLSKVSDTAHIDAELLMLKVIHKERSFIFAHPEYEIDASEVRKFHALLERRLLGEPVAHLIEEREFWSLPLKVNKHTLIPRPDTEILVEKVLEFLPAESCRVLDLGTGTGAIALSIARERGDCEVVAVDVVAEAVALAKENAENLKIKNVSILKSDWFSVVEGKFACIVSNPPYIDAQDEHLNVGDVRFEPHSALVAENQGFSDIELIVHQAKQYLLPEGGLFIEHGWQQGKNVREIFCNSGYQDVTTYQDYGGNERVTYGKWVK